MPTITVWTWDNLGYELIASQSGLQISWWIKMTDLWTYIQVESSSIILFEKVRAESSIEKCHIRDASWARNALKQVFCNSSSIMSFCFGVDRSCKWKALGIILTLDYVQLSQDVFSVYLLLLMFLWKSIMQLSLVRCIKS